MAKRGMGGNVEGWVAKSVARQLATASTLGSNPDIPQKIINGRHKQRSGRHTLARQKKIKKKKKLLTVLVFLTNILSATCLRFHKVAF